MKHQLFSDVQTSLIKVPARLKPWLTCHTSSPLGCVLLLICLLFLLSEHCQSTYVRIQPAAWNRHCYYYLSDK